MIVSCTKVCVREIERSFSIQIYREIVAEIYLYLDLSVITRYSAIQFMHTRCDNTSWL